METDIIKEVAAERRAGIGGTAAFNDGFVPGFVVS